jgi:hypothetical protein
MDLDQSGKYIIAVVIVGAVLGIGFVVAGGNSGVGTAGDNSETGTAGDNSEIGTAGDTPAPEPKSNLSYSQLYNATTQTIEDAGSYTSNMSRVQTGETGNSTTLVQTNTTRRVDFTADKGILITDESVETPQFSQNITISAYTDENGSYSRQMVSDIPSYRTSTGSDRAGFRTVNISRAELNPLTVINAFEWEPTNGTEEVNGVSTLRYTSTNVTNPILVAGAPREDIANTQASVWLDGTDTVQKLTYSYTVQTDRQNETVESTFVLSDVGSTSVSEPGWVSEAIANSEVGTPTEDTFTETPESSTETAESSTETATEPAS